MVAPTSTGKTQIGMWAIAHGIESRNHCVYLVTHRALAKQKFAEFKGAFFNDYLDSVHGSIVLATGDSVVDTEGNTPADPLHSSILVATYEKYLAMLSASGIPSDMTNTVLICDEVQLIGDQYRGKNVELLLTLIKKAGWKQFVGLSAVLDANDSREFSEWLNVPEVRVSQREKHLVYECVTQRGLYLRNTSLEEQEPVVEEIPNSVQLDPISILAWLLRERQTPLPIIVFCMSKRQVYELAQRYYQELLNSPEQQLSLKFEDFPETNANSLLAKYLPCRLAMHCADLTEDEREAIEKSLESNDIDVVFSTSTLAAGVNFPLGTAVFASWERWNSARRNYEAIDNSEFHNMAGRVGRMGTDHDAGSVVYFVNTPRDILRAQDYLDPNSFSSINPHITPAQFEQLILQLIGTNLATNRDQLFDIISETFSGAREQDNNLEGFNNWRGYLNQSVNNLVSSQFIIESLSGGLSISGVGKAVAQSGLQPVSVEFLLDYIANKGCLLSALLPTNEEVGNINSVAFAIFHTCLCSPEFNKECERGLVTRFIPYPLDQDQFNAPMYYDSKDLLHDDTWGVYTASRNASQISLDWMSGGLIGHLERRFPDLSAGMLQELFRNLSWVLQGFSNVLAVAIKSSLLQTLPSFSELSEEKIEQIKGLPRLFSRFTYRLYIGLPDNVLWMQDLTLSTGFSKLTRVEIINLYTRSLIDPIQAASGNADSDNIRLDAFETSKPSSHARANAFRDSVRAWKNDQREKTRARHLIRAEHCPHVQLVKNYYDAIGNGFERSFEEVLNHLNITFTLLDTREATGAPDYLLELENDNNIVFELKSRQNNNLVNYNQATEVLAASEIHGYRDTFCVTLCQPGVDPSVPSLILSCNRLSVIESTDLGEALLRICEGKLTKEQFADWLMTPGQALISDLPFYGT